MPRRGPTVARMIWAMTLAGLFAVSANGPASAASDCRTRPGAYAGPGTHWFYRIDRATQRRCWYVKQIGPAAPRSPEPERVVATANLDGQSFFSWLSSKVSGSTEPSVAEVEQIPATRAAPTRRTEAPPPRRVRVASRSERSTSRPERARTPPTRSAQQSPPPPAARAEAPAPELNDAAKEALYREFLQWRVKQLFAPESR